jgi:hypothetical protein
MVGRPILHASMWYEIFLALLLQCLLPFAFLQGVQLASCIAGSRCRPWSSQRSRRSPFVRADDSYILREAVWKTCFIVRFAMLLLRMGVHVRCQEEGHRACACGKRRVMRSVCLLSLV